MLFSMSGMHPARLREPDDRADPVVDKAVQLGYVDSERVYVVPGLPGHEAANLGRRSVNASARARNLSPAAWVADSGGQPCYRDCPAPDTPHMVCFRLWSKSRGRTHVLRQAGGDPANLKYNPWNKRRRTRYNDAGEPG